MLCELMYDVEEEFREIGGGDPVLVYDEERELFRFHEARFAFSRRYADWDLLRKRERSRGME